MFNISSKYVQNVIKIALVFIATISATFGVGILSQWAQTENPALTNPTFIVGIVFVFGGITVILGILATFMEE